MKKVAFQTLGCKLNFAETSTIGRQFTVHGFEVVDNDQPTDVFVLNTCSVTERADKECRQLIRRALRHSPDAYIIVIGCYAQLQPQEIASIDGVDLVIGSNDKFNIFKYTNSFVKGGAPQIFVSCIDEELDFHPAYSAEVGNRTRAFLKIQDGCDFNCSFCTIPLARGESRSNPIENIIQQANQITSQGFKEIVLTGVNVGDYGKKIDTNILELMKALETVPNINRIRISSIEPNILTKEVVDFILSSKIFCNHFHIPLQSGSDVILKGMRRRYLSKEYQGIVSYIRDCDPSAGIGADVIVGFPGETDDLFSETFSLIAELPVSYLHVFTYSKRPNTPAVNFKNEIEPKIRFRRNEILRQLGMEKRQQFYSSFIGKTLPVLFEGNIRNGVASGLTSNYIRVEVACDDFFINQFYNVRITGVHDDHCIGERISPDDCSVPLNMVEPSLIIQ